MSLDARYPSLADLRARAKWRLPHFVWEYLDSGTGVERVVARNRAALDAIEFMPAILRGEVEASTAVEFLGAKLDMPVGIAPVGMSGLTWPGAERALAAAAITGTTRSKARSLAAASSPGAMPGAATPSLSVML